MAARDLEQPSRIEHLTGRWTTFILQWGRLPLASGQNRRVQQGHPTTGEWGGDHVRQSVSPPGLHAFRLGYNAACFTCGLDVPFYILPPSLHETWKGIYIRAETASWNLIHTKYPLHQTITSFFLRAGHEYIFLKKALKIKIHISAFWVKVRKATPRGVRAKQRNGVMDDSKGKETG